MCIRDSYCFVPVVTDPDGTERLCAKQLMSKKELQSFHRDLDRELESIFGIPGLALTGITKEQGGNKSVSELKKLSEKAELLENEKNRLEAKIDAFCDDLFDGVDDDVVIELFKRLPYKKQFQAVLEAEFPDIQSVSYTHLDVYKRQIYSIGRRSSIRFLKSTWKALSRRIYVPTS